MKDITQSAIIELRQILSQQIIPQVSARESLRMVLARRPLHLPPDIRAKRQSAPDLKVERKLKSNLFLAQYKKEAMHAIRFPYLCYVLQGEIDMRLGIPGLQGKSRGVVKSYDILTLPARTFLLIPPGVFHSDSDQHYLASANSKVFFMRVLPTGVFCHSSTAQKRKVLSPNNLDIFVPSLRFAMLTEMLIEELQSPDKDALEVAQNVLTLLLSRTRRGLSDGASASAGQSVENSQHPQSNPDSSSSTEKSVVIDRACDYIRSHIDKPFSIEDVANHTYVSASHLIRLFRAEIKTTVMKYALEQRLQYAQSLLTNSEISIEEIARFVGYSQTPQFNRVFKRIHHITPSEFRRYHRNK